MVVRIADEGIKRDKRGGLLEPLSPLLQLQPSIRPGIPSRCATALPATPLRSMRNPGPAVAHDDELFHSGYFVEVPLFAWPPLFFCPSNGCCNGA